MPPRSNSPVPNYPHLPNAYVEPVKTKVLSPLYCDAKEAAYLANIDVTQLYDYVKVKDFPAPEIRGAYSRELIFKWVAARKAGLPLPATGRIPRQWLGYTEAAQRGLYTVAEACARAMCTPTTLGMWVRRGDFPKPPHRGVYYKAEVDKWVADRQALIPLPVSGRLPKPWYKILPEEQMYRSRELPDITRYTRSALQHLIERGDFPRKISGLHGMWRKADVDRWVADRLAKKPMPGTGTLAIPWSTKTQREALDSPPLTLQQIVNFVASYRYTHIVKKGLTAEQLLQLPPYAEWRRSYQAADFEEDRCLVNKMCEENGHRERIPPKNPKQATSDQATSDQSPAAADTITSVPPLDIVAPIDTSPARTHGTIELPPAQSPQPRQTKPLVMHEPSPEPSYDDSEDFVETEEERAAFEASREATYGPDSDEDDDFGLDDL